MQTANIVLGKQRKAIAFNTFFMKNQLLQKAPRRKFEWREHTGRELKGKIHSRASPDVQLVYRKMSSDFDILKAIENIGEKTRERARVKLLVPQSKVKRKQELKEAVWHLQNIIRTAPNEEFKVAAAKALAATSIRDAEKAFKDAVCLRTHSIETAKEIRIAYRQLKKNLVEEKRVE